MVYARVFCISGVQDAANEPLLFNPIPSPDYPHLDMKKYHLTSERSNVGREAKNEDSHDLGESLSRTLVGIER